MWLVIAVRIHFTIFPPVRLANVIHTDLSIRPAMIMDNVFAKVLTPACDAGLVYLDTEKCLVVNLNAKVVLRFLTKYIGIPTKARPYHSNPHPHMKL